MYDYSDFPTDAGGYQPQPWIELVLLAAVIVLPIAMYFIGRHFAERDGKKKREDAVTSIYEAINTAARRAAAAVGPAALYATQLLADEIRARLGPVIDLGGPLSGQLKALDAAIKGETKPEDTKVVRPPACTCVCTCACGTGEGSAKAKDDAQAQGQGQGQGQSQVSILTSGSVILAAPPTQPQPAGGSSQADKPALDHHQKVRLVAGDFAQYWGAKEQRLKELRAAQKALLTPAPKKATDGSKSAH